MGREVDWSCSKSLFRFPILWASAHGMLGGRRLLSNVIEFYTKYKHGLLINLFFALIFQDGCASLSVADYKMQHLFYECIKHSDELWIHKKTCCHQPPKTKLSSCMETKVRERNQLMNKSVFQTKGLNWKSNFFLFIPCSELLYIPSIFYIHVVLCFVQS